MSDGMQADGSAKSVGESSTNEFEQLAGPVTSSERIESVDTLRGFAVLGILAMNIYAFALPDLATQNPLVAGSLEGAGFWTWVTTSLLFHQKFMTIFSMLFGAGLVLMAQRADHMGRASGGTYFRRITWLLLIGLIHAIFIWHGDILVSYALCGALLFPLRRLSARVLIPVGFVVLLITIPFSYGTGAIIGYVTSEGRTAVEAKQRGEQLTAEQESMIEGYREMEAQFGSSPEDTQKDMDTFRGDYRTIVKAQASRAAQILFALLLYGWRILGLMLMGMGLMKLGIFSAQWPRWLYVLFIVIGYGLALQVTAYGISQQLAHNFDFIYLLQGGMIYDYVASVFVALAHVSVVMLVCQSGLLPFLRRRLAAVGQMALSNYLMQSIICTLIFYGYGLGLYGRFGYFELMAFVIGVWVLQLAYSPWWLQRFRFGPAEWLWRSLTYIKRQPFRLRPTPSRS